MAVDVIHVWRVKFQGYGGQHIHDMLLLLQPRKSACPLQS